MLINLTEVLTSAGKEHCETVQLEANTVSVMGNVYRICEKEPVLFSFANLENGKALMSGSVKLFLEMSCDRCLKPVMETVEFSFEQELYSPEFSGETEQDDLSWMTDYELDTEAFLNSEILINMPIKVLCKPECKGICRVCGHDLNEGECGCDTFVPDPRMALIKDVFYENYKEV